MTKREIPSHENNVRDRFSTICKNIYVRYFWLLLNIITIGHNKKNDDPDNTCTHKNRWTCV